MDLLMLKQHIIKNPETIELLLERSGFCNITSREKEYRCAAEEGWNPTGVSINKETLSACCYSLNIKGDIITLIQKKLNLPFRKTLNWMGNVLGLKDAGYEQNNIKLPFGGYFKKVKRLIQYSHTDIKTYDDEILNDFYYAPNTMFLKDGINCNTQNKFKIGYDVLTDRITVPWYSINGELIGVMGRLNHKETKPEESKWLPIIPFPKSTSLFGYHTNYHNIVEQGIVFLGESEKFSLQLHSMGIHLGLGLGGNDINNFKAKCIKSLQPKILITCYDEGLEEDFIIEKTKILKSQNMFYDNKVGYVLDKKGIYLPKGSKASPTDFGEKTFHKLVTECVHWI